MYVVAGLTTEVKNQHDALKKARGGLKAAKSLEENIKILIGQFPDDKTIQRTAKDVAVMLKRFTRLEQDAGKMIKKIAKKDMPSELKKLGASVTRALKAKLVDPKSLQTVPWVGADYQGNAVFSFVFRVSGVPNRQNGDLGRVEVEISQNVGNSTGPVLKDRYKEVPAKAKEVAEHMFNKLQGWNGLKGQEEKTSQRAATAKAVASVLNQIVHRRGRDSESAEISRDNATISASYRADLPRTYAEASFESVPMPGVSEYEYYELVEVEIKDLRRKLDPALKPFSDKIQKTYAVDADKSWIDITITLK